MHVLARVLPVFSRPPTPPHPTPPRPARLAVQVGETPRLTAIAELLEEAVQREQGRGTVLEARKHIHLVDSEVRAVVTCGAWVMRALFARAGSMQAHPPGGLGGGRNSSGRFRRKRAKGDALPHRILASRPVQAADDAVQ